MLLLSNNRRSHQGLAPFTATCSEIEQARTNSFHGNNLLNCISSSMVCKIFFLLQICQYSEKVSTREKQIARQLQGVMTFTLCVRALSGTTIYACPSK